MVILQTLFYLIGTLLLWGGTVFVVSQVPTAFLGLVILAGWVLRVIYLDPRR